jgi:hypothetical protein
VLLQKFEKLSIEAFFLVFARFSVTFTTPEFFSVTAISVRKSIKNRQERLSVTVTVRDVPSVIDCQGKWTRETRHGLFPDGYSCQEKPSPSVFSFMPRKTFPVSHATVREGSNFT